MTRNGNMLGLLTVAAAIWTAGTTLAQSDGPPTDSQKIDAIQTQLNDVKKSVEDIKRAIAGLEAMGREMRTAQTDNTVCLQAIKSLSDQLALLQREVESLRTRLNTGTTRISAFPPTTTTGTGRLELRNSYPQEVTIIVNNRAYRVAPGETRLTEPLPAGTVTYQVLEAQRSIQARTLAANETLTIHVHNPR